MYLDLSFAILCVRLPNKVAKPNCSIRCLQICLWIHITTHIVNLHIFKTICKFLNLSNLFCMCIIVLRAFYVCKTSIQILTDTAIIKKQLNFINIAVIFADFQIWKQLWFLSILFVRCSDNWNNKPWIVVCTISFFLFFWSKNCCS